MIPVIIKIHCLESGTSSQKWVRKDAIKMKEIVCATNFVIPLIYGHCSMLERKVRLDTLWFVWMVSWWVSIHLFCKELLPYVFISGKVVAVQRRSQNIWFSNMWTAGFPSFPSWTGRLSQYHLFTSTRFWFILIYFKTQPLSNENKWADDRGWHYYKVLICKCQVMKILHK